MIIDAVIFFNEVDVLDVRIHELAESVDIFVILEARQTFQGHAKPLYFDQVRHRFREWRDKIRHVVIDLPPKLGPWPRQHYQRNYLYSIIKNEFNLQKKDKVIISDVDEIPSAEVIRDRPVNQKPLKLEQNACYYFFNLVRKIPPWYGSTVFRGDLFKPGDPQKSRGKIHQFEVVKNAGWHLSWTGGPEAVKLKAASVSQPNCPINKWSEEEVAKRFQEFVVEGNDQDLRGTRRYPLERRGIDFLPKYVRDNPDKFKDYIL